MRRRKAGGSGSLAGAGAGLGQDRHEEGLGGLHQLTAILWGMQARWEGWGLPSIAGEDPPGDTDPTLAVSTQGSEVRPQQQKQQQRQPNSVSQLEKPIARSSAHSRQPYLPSGHLGSPHEALAWHRLVEGKLRGFRGGHPIPATSSHRIMGIAWGSPPCCLTPSLHRCWGWRGARWGARSRRSAGSDTRRWRCAWVGAGRGGTRYWHPSWGRYVLHHTPVGDPLGDSSGQGC